MRLYCVMNINKFNIGDIVDICIPPEYEYLYPNIDNTVIHRITRIISFASNDHKTKNWHYEIDSENILVTERWITPCDDDDIEPIDIKYIIGI